MKPICIYVSDFLSNDMKSIYSICKEIGFTVFTPVFDENNDLRTYEINLRLLNLSSIAIVNLTRLNVQDDIGYIVGYMTGMDKSVIGLNPCNNHKYMEPIIKHSIIISSMNKLKKLLMIDFNYRNRLADSTV
jgi:nucleoside 2-deoxyribosyltransferase